MTPSINETDGFAFVDLTRDARIAAIAAKARPRVVESRNSTTKKDYLRGLLSTRDFAEFPDLVMLALEEPILQAAEAYLGARPRLRSLQLFYTPRNDTTAGSQKAHFDHVGERQLKLFVYLNDIDEECGPFCFVPAHASKAFRSRPLPKGGRFEDAELAAELGADSIFHLIGSAGAGLLVDTTRCLHFGGRTRRGERLMATAQYVRPGDDFEANGVVRPSAPAGIALTARQQVAVAVA